MTHRRTRSSAALIADAIVRSKNSSRTSTGSSPPRGGLTPSLRRAKNGGYQGGKSAFFALVAGLRAPPSPPIVRFEGLPGEFSQHDFGEIDVRFVDGTRKRVHFFASRLKYSRFVAVSLVDYQRTETLVRTLVQHFGAFGGVPLLAVFDRPRTIVTKSGPGRRVEQFNATFAEVMLELGVGVEMCAPRSGQQKGSVEHLVKWVKSSFGPLSGAPGPPCSIERVSAWVDGRTARLVDRALAASRHPRDPVGRLELMRVRAADLV